MRKSATIVFLVSMLLLTACSTSSEVTETKTTTEASVAESVSETESIAETKELTESSVSETEAITESLSETEWKDPALLPVRLSERDISGYTISGYISVYDEQTNTRTDYIGDITDKEDISAVKEFITLTEALPEADISDFYGVNGSTDENALEIQRLCEEMGIHWINKKIKDGIV